MTNTKFAFNFMLVALFMSILDIQIVASSIADIQAYFSATADEVAWIQTSYLIAEVITIAMSAWFVKVFSTRYAFSVACLGFTIASALCATSQTLTQIIFFRVIQGAAGGILMPTVFSMIMVISRDNKSQSLEMIKAGLIATLAPTIGPALGGVITDNYSWQWLFLINIIPGLTVSYVVYKYLDVDKPRFNKLKDFDILGFIFLVGFLGSLEYILKEGPKVEWFDSTKIIYLTVFCLSSFVFLLLQTITRKDAIIQLSAFKDRNFTTSCFLSFSIGIILYGVVYLYPVMLSSVRSYNSIQIGTIMCVVGVFQFASGPVANLVSLKLNLKTMSAIGMIGVGISLVVNSSMTTEVSFTELLLPQAIRGLFIMFCFLPITRLVYITLPEHQINDASGIYTLMRNLGGAIGIAVITNLVRTRFVHHKYLLSSNYDVIRHNVYNNILDTSELQISAVMNKLISNEAYIRAFNDIFFALGIYVALCCVFIAFFKLQPQRNVQARN
ncbi:MAG: DHA2 family efflux MFS transporter permease subunit [Rickettsiales bacterium]|nr:DHA2 family efflux MFS transporter permease subunit [Rickettsiales bacterium]